MSLRSALTAFTKAFGRKKSKTPLGEALQEFARSITTKATKQDFPEQQRTLSKLAQRVLALSSVAGGEDGRIIAGACTLLAGALTRRVRGEVLANDDDWRWLARWPELLLNCLEGSYNEAETLVCHVLEPAWTSLLSPGAVHVLLERLNGLPDAPGMPSQKLLSLYEQYCDRHGTGDLVADRTVGQAVSERSEQVETGENVHGLENVEVDDAIQEDEVIAAEGTGISADSSDLFNSVMEFSMMDYVPADDISGDENDPVIHAVGDATLSAGTSRDWVASDQTVFDSAAKHDGEPGSFVEQVVADFLNHDKPVDQSLTATVNVEASVDNGVNRIDSNRNSGVLEPIGEVLTNDAMRGGEVNESPSTIEALFPRASNDDDSQQRSQGGSGSSDDVVARGVSSAQFESTSTDAGLLRALRSLALDAEEIGAKEIGTVGNHDTGYGDQDSANDASIGVGGSDVPQSAGWPEMLDAISEMQANNSDSNDQPYSSGDGPLQFPLPDIEIPQAVVSGESDVLSQSQLLPEMDWIESEDTTADVGSFRDDATVDMFDALESGVAGEEENALVIAELTESAPTESNDAGSAEQVPSSGGKTVSKSGNVSVLGGGSFEFGGGATEEIDADVEAETALRMLDEQNEAIPSLEDVFDAFDGITVSDDAAMNLGEFVLAEEETTSIDSDVPPEIESADTERSGVLASPNSAVPCLNEAGNNVVDDATNDAASVQQRSLQMGAVVGRKLSRAAKQIVDVLLAELPEVEVELGTSAGLGASASTDRKVVGEAAQRCGEVLKRYGAAADSVGFVGLARVIEFAREHVLVVTHTQSLSDRQIGLFSMFTDIVRAYFKAPYAPESAQSLIDWITNDGWTTPAAIADPEVLFSLLANPDLSAIDEDVPGRQQRANPEDVSLAIPADANRELIDGLLQELPIQSEVFSAAIERLMHGTGTQEDILTAQRIAHTIKGSGNTVGIRGLAVLSHNIEDILLVLAQEKRLPSQPLADMLMNAADRLQAMTESLLGMGPPPDDALDVLQSVLDWANLIDLEGLPPDDAGPESLPEAIPDSLLRSTAPVSAARAVAAPAESDVVNSNGPAPSKDSDRKPYEAQKGNGERKVDHELETLLRVPARLVDQMLTTAGESIILTGQLRDRVRRGLTDVRAMFAQFERQQQLGGELEELIDVKDFSRRQMQQDSRFDALEMDQYNELHSAARQLVESATDVREMGRALVDHLSSLDEMLISQEVLNREAQDTVLHTRMVDVKSVFQRLQRAVRQTCRATDKQVELHLSGGETPMDSDALNRIVDPLMHLLRNAVDHGIEEAATRLRNGKAATGNVYLDFQRDGNNIVIRCRDDGAGLDYDAIRRAAEERGLIGPEASQDALKQIILRANFSTRAQATQVSGRGIGLDAVHDGVSLLGGTMTVDSETGQGCSFELSLPFNLISSHAVLVRAGPSVIALASRGVEQIVHGRDGEMQRFGGKTVFQIGDNVYPATTLETVIGANSERREGERHIRPVVLTRTDEGVTAVSVEAVIGSRDLVVKSLGKHLPKLRGVVGATILGDGQVASVIDLPDLLSKRDVGVEHLSATATDTTTETKEGFVLVVDDSLSARRALAQFMQDSGYRVRTARDGVEASQIVEGVRPDLVLADLEMPRMNGIELTTHLRSNAETADIPVIMVTSRSTEKHREEAQAAGVNVYLTKPYSEDVLIETVRALIGEHEAKCRERPAA